MVDSSILLWCIWLLLVVSIAILTGLMTLNICRVIRRFVIILLVCVIRLNRDWLFVVTAVMDAMLGLLVRLLVSVIWTMLLILWSIGLFFRLLLVCLLLVLVAVLVIGCRGWGSFCVSGSYGLFCVVEWSGLGRR